MAMSDCDHCWETPCSCGYAYWFMDLTRLKELARVTRKVLGDRRGHRRPPGAVREEMQRRPRWPLVDAKDVGGSTPPRSPRTGDEGGSTPSNGPRSDMGARGPGDTGHL